MMFDLLINYHVKYIIDYGCDILLGRSLLNKNFHFIEIVNLDITKCS